MDELHLRLFTARRNARIASAVLIIIIIEWRVLDWT